MNPDASDSSHFTPGRMSDQSRTEVMNARIRALLLPLALLPAHAAALDHIAIDTLPIRVPQHVVISNGTERSYGIHVSAGTYLQGDLAVALGRISLHLETPEHVHLRLLEENARGTRTFRHVSDGAPLLLTISAGDDAPAEATLTLTHAIPPGEQEGQDALPQSPTLRALAGVLASGGDTDSFWADMAARGTPLREPAPDGSRNQILVTFLYRGAARNVRLWGGPSNDHDWLERLGDSEVWYRTYLVPDSLRLFYRLAPDVPRIPGNPGERRRALLAVAQADPLNTTPVPGDAPDAYGRYSYLELGGAPPQPGYPPDLVISGRIEHYPFTSAILGNMRDITLYLPAGFDPEDPANVLLFVFDGADYLSARAPIPGMLDRLIAQGRLPPVAAVFVDAVDPDLRARELTCDPGFADMLATELLTEVVTRTGLAQDPGRTAVAGSSFGGLAAACAAYRHPQAFGNFLSLSGSYWWQPADYPPDGTPADAMPHVSDLFARAPRLPLRAYLSAGTFEAGKGGDTDILGGTRHLRDVLRLKGYEDVFYREYAGGHDYAIWRGSLTDGLLDLFGTSGQDTGR
ncbi:alpha/beta hydrolase-fold protein [Tropicimonas sp.]|uniref:alpha/beta hydrolase-fold protein n=1 Tax=Tropicimonas sp. TaxID=2067044 RepID=UPI003A8A4071